MPASAPIYIFDLDGTLADATERQRLLGPEPDAVAWEAFDKAGCDDRPIPAVVRTLHLLRAAGAGLLLMTGRSAAYRAATVGWLVEHAGFVPTDLEDCLFMRPAGDRTPITQLKRRWLEGLAPADRCRVVGVFEDQSRVVAMWRSLGLVCFQVAPDAACATHGSGN